jgi:hypothetical protein
MMATKKKMSKTKPLIPMPPLPPLDRHIIWGGITFGFCPNCYSSLKRKYIFFGKKYCIHPECFNHLGILTENEVLINRTKIAERLSDEEKSKWKMTRGGIESTDFEIFKDEKGYIIRVKR